MERRYHPRRLADLRVQATNLHTGCVHSGRVENMSKAGLCVLLAEEIAEGTPLRMEVADSIVYGFVTYARFGNEGFRTGIELQQVLIGVSKLARILESDLRAFVPDLAGLPAPEAYLG
jgi:hypothetical protein